MCWSRISRKRLEIKTRLYNRAPIGNGESNGHVIDDVAGRRRCGRPAEVTVSDCLSSLYFGCILLVLLQFLLVYDGSNDDW